MRYRAVIYFTGFIIAIAGFLVFDYSVRSQHINRKPAVSNTSSVIKPGVAIQENTRFIERYKYFVSQIDKITDDPDASEELTHQFAQTLKPENMNYLYEVLVSSEEKTDARSLALELLSINPTFEMHQMLNQFAQNEKFADKSDSEFELALRAQAIEAMTLFADKKLVKKNLENIKIRTNQAFLYDRANRALAFLSGENLANEQEVEDQNAKAFKK